MSSVFSLTDPGQLSSVIPTINESMGKEKREFEELPPLLDPILCKDLKNLAKTVEMHKDWLEKEWSIPSTAVKADITSKTVIPTPAPKKAKQFYS